MRACVVRVGNKWVRSGLGWGMNVGQEVTRLRAEREVHTGALTCRPYCRERGRTCTRAYM